MQEIVNQQPVETDGESINLLNNKKSSPIARFPFLKDHVLAFPSAATGYLVFSTSNWPLHQNEHFFEGTHPTPLKNQISTLPTKSPTFYTINIFSHIFEGFPFFFSLWGAFLAHLTTRNTFISLCICPKMRFFP